jgi:hypothetical protein
LELCALSSGPPRDAFDATFMSTQAGAVQRREPEPHRADAAGEASQ